MSKKKILVIDDEKSARDLLKTSIEFKGYSVETAADGQLGFEKAVTEEFDLVIIDIKMPNWNGLEAIGSLEIVKPDLKIIVISGFIHDHEIKIIKKSPNVLTSFMKPFLIKNILEEIEKGLQ